MSNISPESVHQKLEINEINPRQIIDVRTLLELKTVKIKGAEHHPLDDLNADQFRGADRCLYLLCGSGKRAEKARSKLAPHLACELVVIEGGMQAWEGANLPVERGTQVMSLERQVRVAAGTLIVIGAILGFTVHPNFHFLSGFVGAGLIFAGLTGTCGMGLLMAKMPWNRKF